MEGYQPGEKYRADSKILRWSDIDGVDVVMMVTTMEPTSIDDKTTMTMMMLAPILSGG